MIHKIPVDDIYHYCISSYQCWRPGNYEDERTARWAFRFDDEILDKLQDEANARATCDKERVITWGDLARAKSNRS